MHIIVWSIYYTIIEAIFAHYIQEYISVVEVFLLMLHLFFFIRDQ